ncbi:TMEM175 family protein [Hymenobacter crusticola]|uniref:DUF1211 domain-containing membrane protein n=1 Tax=Hymenobacter crusticola TaxID=1770526 RepID=A0A243WD90_9BACT|nr:TMEM175 family protein [Hymenobacter crusticola]OUJ73405.1 hypothetical protein BXP70_13395 [Hymenobacter crusticola]
MSHVDTPLEHDDRMEFQLERLILFTDAVFAIAITLLVIEIKVPELHHVQSERAVMIATLNLLPKFIGFLVAFFVIAIYWTAHHRVFRFVHRYTTGLIWLNIVFLLSIVLMPFTAAFQGDYPTMKTPWILYACCVIFTGLMQVRLQVYIRNPARGLTLRHHSTHPDLDPFRPLISVLIFSLSLVLSAVGFILAAKFTLLLIWPFMVLYNRYRYRPLLRAYEQRFGVAA